MSGSLTPQEREDLASAAAAIRAAGSALEKDRATARQFADVARSALEGIDEVTIGRVLLLVAAAIPQLQRTGHDPRTIGNVFTLAAIDLTASDAASPDSPKET
ncbi:hypothetical protein [Nonomuraea sp. GTA35]|uniref:hypothetical protein n=1 Tax=Nonomuraea sp. GTA35 TaxID=1676746 RepID=UPI0035C22690